MQVEMMLSPLPWLLAKSRIESMNRAFLEKRSIDSSSMMLTLGGIVLVLGLSLLAYYIHKKRSERILNDSKKLFGEMCRAHQFSRAQMKVFRAFSKIKSPADPCQLFLESKLWILDPHSDKKFCSPKARESLSAIQSMLFTTSSEPEVAT